MTQSLFDCLFQPIRGKSLSKNKFTCENAVSQTQYGSWTLRVMGSCKSLQSFDITVSVRLISKVPFHIYGNCTPPEMIPKSTLKNDTDPEMTPGFFPRWPQNDAQVIMERNSIWYLKLKKNFY